MAKKRRSPPRLVKTDVTKAATLPTKQTPPKALREVSTTGLKMSDGRIYDDCEVEFQWPYAYDLFKKMSRDSSVSAAMTVIKSMIRKIRYKTKVDNPSPSETQKAQIDFIESCRGDMETSWADFINETLSILYFGHSIHEKVFKYRNGLDGKVPSLYNDGKLGWKKLPIRSQGSIYKWIYDNKKRNLIKVRQNIPNATTVQYEGNGKPFDSNFIDIPANKLLHFKHDSQLENPEGNSPLKNCYVPWKYKTTLEELEAIGVSKDMRGVLKIKLPAEYLSPDASEDQKAVVKWGEDTINNYHNNEAVGFIQPSFIDPITKVDRFDMELMGVKGNGGRSYDMDKMINRYDNKILMAYLADVLKLGQDSVGSFALAGSKTNLLAVGIQAVLDEILDVINRDLVIQTLKLNGWDLDNGEQIPYITYEDLDERDLDELGKFIQRAVSVGAIEKTEPLSEALLETARLPLPDRSKPIKPEMTSGSNSDAGRGMQTAGEGNSTTVGGSDSSTSNTENS